MAGGCERDFSFLDDKAPKDVDVRDVHEAGMPDTSVTPSRDAEVEADAPRDTPATSDAGDALSEDVAAGDDAPNDTSESSMPDVPDAGPRRVPTHQIAMSGSHLCVIDPASNDVLCRGEGGKGKEPVEAGAEGDAAASAWQVVTASLDGSKLEGARTIAVGLGFGCAIAFNDVLCWGTDPGTQQRYAFAQILLLGAGNEFEFLQAGEGHVCVASPVYCWGDNTYSQITDLSLIGSTTIRGPALRPELAGKQLLTLGARHSCANDGDRTLCWGLDDYRQCGNKADGLCLPDAPCSEKPVEVDGVSGALGLGLGTTHTCAIKADRTVACWGLSDKGQAGILPIDCDADGCIADLADVANLHGATRLALGKAHSCALTEDRLVFCWGSNEVGQVGIGSQGGMAAHALPVQLPNGDPLRDVDDLAAGDALTCATSLGKLYCWGAWAPGTTFSAATEIPLDH
jgi:hypothetical protein